MMTVALVTARAARDLDEDLPPLADALRKKGVEVHIDSWDDDQVDWSIFDVAILRSTWDYAERLSEFTAWIDRVTASTTVLNPPALLGWNTDKHYIADLAARGVPTIPTTFVEPEHDAEQALAQFLVQSSAAEFVVKPAVGAGARDVQRYSRSDADRAAATAHIQRLLQTNRSVLLQPYLDHVDLAGETALIFFAGQFDHAIRKGAILRPGEGSTQALFAEEKIEARIPEQDELDIGHRAIAALGATAPLYARVDLIRDAHGAPCLSELELTEPSLYFNYSTGAAERFAELICERCR